MLVEAAGIVGKERIGATDDCGFSPFSIDVKPKHGDGPDFAREVAYRKRRLGFRERGWPAKSWVSDRQCMVLRRVMRSIRRSKS